MALTKHPVSIEVDSPPREQSRNVPPLPPANLPVVELWYGDITASGAISKEDIVVLSNSPQNTMIGSTHILTWGRSLMPGPPKKWFGLNPCLNVEAYQALSSSPVGDFLFWDPTFGPLTTAQATPYKTDDIFRGAQAMWGHIPKSILIPLTTGDNGFCTSAILLQSLLMSALKIGGWRKYIPTTIKIVLDKKDALAIGVFDAIAANYDTLRGAANKGVGTQGPAGFPTSNSQPYSYYMGQANSWMSNLWASVKDVNPLTEYQAFAINIYTSSYYSAMVGAQRHLIKNDGIFPIPGSKPMPTYFNNGFVDLANLEYQAQVPLFAVLSAGLSNIPAYHGTTFRGTGGGSYMNSYQPGNGVRFLSYLSSADEFYGVGLPWPKTRYRDEWGKKVNKPTTKPPWNANYHVRTQSLTARDISPYSMHQYEREHLYDFEFLEFFTSREKSGHPTPGNTLTGNLASVQVTDPILPLLK